MKMPVEIEIMKKTACDAVKKNYFRFAVCIWNRSSTILRLLIQWIQ